MELVGYNTKTEEASFYSLFNSLWWRKVCSNAD